MSVNDIWNKSYMNCANDFFHGNIWTHNWPAPNVSGFIAQLVEHHTRARNNGRSTDNVRTDCGFDRSNCRLAGHVDRSKFNSIENEINLRFLLFSCFSCYLSSRCVLRNFDMKSWWHATRAIVYNSRIETDIGIPPLPVTKLPNISTFISNFQVVHSHSNFPHTKVKMPGYHAS